MAVRAGVAVHARTDRTGNAGQRFETLQTAVDGEIHQILEDRAGVALDTVPRRQHTPRHEAQHDAAKAEIGDDQVGAAADHHVVDGRWRAPWRAPG